MDAPARSDNVRVRRNIRATALAVLILAGAVIAIVLAWGYWRVSSHGDIQVSLHDVSLKTDRQLYGDVKVADVRFDDGNGRPLAHTRADGPLGIVLMIHPDVGDCRREEREGGEAWRNCYDTLSQWLMTWVRDVRSARVRLDSCTIEHVPVDVEESRDNWWLWWVPLPHIDNSTSTHFHVTMWIDSANCRAADRVH